MHPDITVAIPTIPPRANVQLPRAVRSVAAQIAPPVAVAIAVDIERQGAWATRQRALDAVSTEWVAFLDDNDELMPHHLATLHAAAVESNADYVYSWHSNERNAPRHDPFTFLDEPFDADRPHYPLMTALVRTELARAVGFTPPGDERDVVSGEDTRFLVGCLKAGADIYLVRERTWWWWRDVSTDGLARRWDPTLRQFTNTW